MTIHKLTADALKRVRQGAGLGTLVTLAREPGLLQVLGVEDPESGRTRLLQLINGMYEPARTLLCVVFNCESRDQEVMQRRSLFIKQNPGVAGSAATFHRLETEYLKSLTKRIADQFAQSPQNSERLDVIDNHIAGVRYHTSIDFREADHSSPLLGLGRSHFRLDYDIDSSAGPHQIKLEVCEPPVGSGLILSRRKIVLQTNRFTSSWYHDNRPHLIHSVAVRILLEPVRNSQTFPNWIWGVQDWEKEGALSILRPVKEWRPAPCWVDKEYTFERDQYHVLAFIESKDEIKTIGGEFVDDSTNNRRRRRPG